MRGEGAALVPSQPSPWQSVSLRSERPLRVHAQPQVRATHHEARGGATPMAAPGLWGSRPGRSGMRPGLRSAGNSARKSAPRARRLTITCCSGAVVSMWGWPTPLHGPKLALESPCRGVGRRPPPRRDLRRNRPTSRSNHGSMASVGSGGGSHQTYFRPNPSFETPCRALLLLFQVCFSVRYVA